MLDFHYLATPQGQQLLMFLEETGLPYRRIARPAALALVDHWPADGGAALPLQESGAILLYLAEKAGFGLPASVRGRAAVRQWLFWQKAFECQGRPTAELFGVLEKQLEFGAYLCGEHYTIADLACFPWVSARGAALAGHPQLARWFHAISQRPATQRAYGRDISLAQKLSTVVPDPKVDKSSFREKDEALAGVLP